MIKIGDNMNQRIIDLGRSALFTVVVVVAVISFAISHWQSLVTGSWNLNPQLVFEVLVFLLFIVICLGYLFGSAPTSQEEWTFTDIAMASVWALYLLAGLAFVLSGFTGWVVLTHLAIAIGGGLAFWYLYNPE